ncbi:hypothetical protein AC578_3941 [Pseudocercospora eumusae]|uniref:Uncharacterized protein n=1 Tax=Pseudocercospora eumusae TaxID=321146 RepID=A0A139GXK3_9PEZI|nr:hypothetical protein AC578_3941 [Pseudocercospora eumusae]
MLRDLDKEPRLRVIITSPYISQSFPLHHQRLKCAVPGFTGRAQHTGEHARLNGPQRHLKQKRQYEYKRKPSDFGCRADKRRYTMALCNTSVEGFRSGGTIQTCGRLKNQHSALELVAESAASVTGWTQLRRLCNLFSAASVVVRAKVKLLSAMAGRFGIYRQFADWRLVRDQKSLQEL